MKTGMEMELARCTRTLCVPSFSCMGQPGTNALSMAYEIGVFGHTILTKASSYNRVVPLEQASFISSRCVRLPAACS